MFIGTPCKYVIQEDNILVCLLRQMVRIVEFFGQTVMSALFLGFCPPPHRAIKFRLTDACNVSSIQLICFKQNKTIL